MPAASATNAGTTNTGTGKKPTDRRAALTAAAIRQELREAGIKPEKIKARTYKSSNSVDITLLDPSPDVRRKAQKIARLHQYGSFDGMEDIYLYNNAVEGVHQVRYTHVNTRFSPELQALAKTFVIQNFPDYAENPQGAPQRDYVYWVMYGELPGYQGFWPEENS